MPGRHCASRLERDRRLEHVEARGIGRGVRPARLSPHVLDFGERLEDRVLLREASRARARRGMPGSVVGMKRIVPSSSGGMNSLPMRVHGIQVSDEHDDGRQR